MPWCAILDCTSWQGPARGGRRPGRGPPPGGLWPGRARRGRGRTRGHLRGAEGIGYDGAFLQDIWALDLPTLTWNEVEHYHRDGPEGGRYGPVLVADAAHDRLLAWAGRGDPQLGPTNEVWAYGLEDQAWRLLQPGDEALSEDERSACDTGPATRVVVHRALPERRYAGAGAMMGDGRLVVFGGLTDCGVIDDVWIFDPASGTWTEEVAATAGESCGRAGGDCEGYCP